MAALRNRKMGSILDNNKSFCLAPWIHSYISPQGLRQICCVAEHNFGINQSLESIWNSDEMKDIRTKMMNGEILSACNRCNDKSINPNPYRDYFNRQYEWYTNDIISNTKEDGTFNGVPRTFDYRTNVCNFKCKMCSEEFSSQIQGEKLNNGLDLQFNILNSDERERSLQIINNDTVRKNVSLKYFNKICDKDKILNELKQNIKKNKCCELLTIIAIYDEMIHIYFTHRAELQIKNYNIINIKLLEKIYKRFIKLSGLSNQNVNTIFEVSVQKIINNKKIQGAIDMIYNDTIIEFKCKTFTTKEDIYQLLIYAYLLDKKF